MGYKVAVVGATGNVGLEMLNILSERQFPADEVIALASSYRMHVPAKAFLEDRVAQFEHAVEAMSGHAGVGTVAH